MKRPDDVKKCSVDGQDVVLYRFDAASSAGAVRGGLTGSVGKVIECDVAQEDLHVITPTQLSPLSFGLGAAARAGDDAIDNLGEALKMDGRFFMALPSRVGAHDPYTVTDGDVMSPFFFQADLNFGAHPPMLESSSSGPTMKGALESGSVFAFEAQEPISMASILAEVVPEGMNAVYFRGTAFARDIVDKIMKISPTPAHRKPYGKITTPQGLKDFFVMKTIPEGFEGMVEVAAFGAAFKSYAAEKQSPNLDELLSKLFYVTPGTIQSADVRIHMHGLILSASDSAPVPPKGSVDLNKLPLSYVKEGKGDATPRSGRIVHLENTTRLASGSFAIAAMTGF